MSYIQKQSAPMPLRQKLSFCVDAANGMRYLHSSSPPHIHRDLKPQNMLVTSHQSIKITDFGTARLLSVANEIQAKAQSRFVGDDLNISSSLTTL